MAYYKPGTRINLKKKDEYALFTRVSNAIFPYIVAVLAGYGFIDLLLTSNGL